MKHRRERQTTTRRKTKRGPGDQWIDLPDGDSHAHIRPKPDVLFAPAPLIVETVFISKVGHTFGAAPPYPGEPPAYIVQDFLLDQTGASGADGKMSATKSFDLTTAAMYRFNLFPKDRSRRIKVVPPAGAQVFMGLNAGRRFVSALSDVEDQYGAVTFFEYLAGSAPAFTYNSFFIGQNTNHWIQFVVEATVATPISFGGFVTFGTYPQRTFDPGLKSYIPFSTGLPYNLPGPDAVPFLLFGYVTTNPTDPGPLVFLT